MRDPKSGRDFWFDRASGTSQWELPQEEGEERRRMVGALQDDTAQTIELQVTDETPGPHFGKDDAALFPVAGQAGGIEVEQASEDDDEFVAVCAFGGWIVRTREREKVVVMTVVLVRNSRLLLSLDRPLPQAILSRSLRQWLPSERALLPWRPLHLHHCLLHRLLLQSLPPNEHLEHRRRWWLRMGSRPRWRRKSFWTLLRTPRQLLRLPWRWQSACLWLWSCRMPAIGTEKAESRLCYIFHKNEINAVSSQHSVLSRRQECGHLCRCAAAPDASRSCSSSGGRGRKWKQIGRWRGTGQLGLVSSRQK